MDPSFSTIDYESRLVFDTMNGASLYSSDPDYDYTTKLQMRRSASSTSGFIAPGLMPSTDHDSSRSASSSTVGSPYSGHMQMAPQQETYHPYAMHGLGVTPAIVGQDGFQHDYNHLPENELLGWASFAESQKINNGIDPSLINTASYPEENIYGMQHAFSHASPVPSPAITPNQMAYNPHFSQPASPAPSHNQWVYAPQFQQPMNNSFVEQNYMGRRSSLHSFTSGPSHPSPSSDMNEEGEKGRCPFPECGKAFKDLKAHMLTHQAERPEKCPITSCEYHLKGFARKYDKNRHTLTHYKGTMVCGFCPDTGTSSEKTFNRADVFKRHLTSVHHVEQTPPNSRKRSPGAANKKSDNYQQDAVAGKCSTCQAVFPSPQDFYEHLDDCVLRMVQQVEPSEDINAQHLSTISNDKEVQDTFDRHMIKMEDNPTSFDDDEDDDEDDEDDEDSSYPSRSSKAGLRGNKPANRVVLNGAITKKVNKKGLTWSQGGVALVGKGRKKRKDYPPAWGMHADKMRMKKRVTCVYDGQRRLAKDELMLNNEFEVRLPLPGGQGYVTDLDVETIKRAEGFLNASDAEKGPWNFQEMIQPAVDLHELMS